MGIFNQCIKQKQFTYPVINSSRNNNRKQFKLTKRCRKILKPNERN